MTGTSPRPPGIVLAELTWLEAAQVLTPQTVVVIPLGAGAKEHGPHLRLNNDHVLADALAQRLAAATEVVIAPTVTYSFYPAFLGYPGSVSLRLETARDTVVDICRSLARHGPRRFYILNTGISTLRALQPASEILASEGVLLHYTDLAMLLGPISARIGQQVGGSHADEIETSLMLALAPNLVDMSRAVNDYHRGNGALTRDPQEPGIYSPTGVYGDATLASCDKGFEILAALLSGIIRDIDQLRATPTEA